MHFFLKSRQKMIVSKHQYGVEEKFINMLHLRGVNERKYVFQSGLLNSFTGFSRVEDVGEARDDQLLEWDFVHISPVFQSRSLNRFSEFFEIFEEEKDSWEVRIN